MVTVRKSKGTVASKKGTNTRVTRNVSVIQTRVDPSLREKSDMILGRLGITTPDAIRMFLEQVVLRRGIPFDVRLPSDIQPEPLENTSETAWSVETEVAFRKALDDIDMKFGNALRNLAK